MWDIQTPQSPTLVATLRGPEQPISTITLNPTGNLLAAASEDGTIVIWDVEGKPCHKPRPNLYSYIESGWYNFQNNEAIWSMNSYGSTNLPEAALPKIYKTNNDPTVSRSLIIDQLKKHDNWCAAETIIRDFGNPPLPN